MVINLDQFLNLKEKHNTQLFVFLLNDEMSHLDSGTMWYGLKCPVFLVRMSEEEFHQMDMSTHPKVLCTKSGKELFDHNGIPSLKFIKQWLT